MKLMFLFRQLPCVLVAVGLLAGSGPLQGAQRPSVTPPAQSTSAGVCGGQPACYETSDFAAIITDFRVSDWNVNKVIDMTVRFQNKTNQPLILGYTDGSAMALDDQGNRFSLNGGPNALRGIGRVVGNTADPKFVLQPGGVGDALFELIGRPSGTAGVTFENDLTIREITPLEGNQFGLGSEFPLQFRGLANGIGVASPASPGQAPASATTALTSAMGSVGAVTAQIPCSPGGSGLGNATSTLTAAANSVGGQGVTASANSTISGATNAITNLRSIFGRKKAAAAAPAAPAPNANTAAPCVPAADSAATAASTATPALNAAVPQAPGGSTVVAAPAIATRAHANATTARVATSAKAPARVAAPAIATRARTSTTTTRVATAAKAPAKVAKPAAKKPAAPTVPTSK